jgi:hypothetical protein
LTPLNFNRSLREFLLPPLKHVTVPPPAPLEDEVDEEVESPGLPDLSPRLLKSWMPR